MGEPTHLFVSGLIHTKKFGPCVQLAPVLEEISSSKVLEMIEDNTITEGMIPKINTCLDAINNEVTAVAIIDGRKKHSILFEIFITLL